MMDAALTPLSTGFSLAYTVVQVSMIAALVRERERARVRHYMLSPVIALPMTAVAMIGIAASNSCLNYLGLAHYGVVQLLIGAGISAALGYGGGEAIVERDADDQSHHRGTLVADRQPATFSRLRQNAREAGITLAGTAVPAQDETKHFKLIGTTGTGKSTAIQEIMAGALKRGDRAVIADPDGGYLRRFYRPARGDVILNPFDDRSVKWDLFSEIESDYDVEQLARSLIPDHEGQDRSWRGYARTFFAAVTRQAHASGTKDVEELYRLLVVADTGELRELVRGTPAQPFLEEHNSRMFDSIRSVTSSAVGALEYVGRQTAQGFSVRKWVSEKTPGVLFVPYKAGQIAALRSTISAWMRLAIFEAMDSDAPGYDDSRDSKRRLWFVVDELDALGQIDGLKDALARLRKFGGRCVLGFQSIAQVSSTYGQGDAHTIVENCSNSLILRCSGSENGGTSQFASRLIGDREVLRRQVSRGSDRENALSTRGARRSRSITEQHATEPAVMPSELEQLPDLCGYLKRASSPGWLKVAFGNRRGGEHRRFSLRSPPP
jgi:type IV secretory pathway TraG/TraD family ATPase VirD4